MRPENRRARTVAGLVALTQPLQDPLQPVGRDVAFAEGWEQPTDAQLRRGGINPGDEVPRAITPNRASRKASSHSGLVPCPLRSTAPIRNRSSRRSTGRTSRSTSRVRSGNRRRASSRNPGCSRTSPASSADGIGSPSAGTTIRSASATTVANCSSWRTSSGATEWPEESGSQLAVTSCCRSSPESAAELRARAGGTSPRRSVPLTSVAGARGESRGGRLRSA